jgi:molybdopterin molybdotransferase
MAGHRDPFRRQIVARLADNVRRHATLDQFVRVTFAWPDDGSLPTAALTGPQGSGMLMSLVRADGLAVIPAGDGFQAAGSTVTAMPFDR